MNNRRLHIYRIILHVILYTYIAFLGVNKSFCQENVGNFVGFGKRTIDLAKENNTSFSGDISNVRDFGAKCDGSSDDTAAFTKIYAALNVIGGGRIILPWNSDCHIKGTLIAKTPIVVEGAGKYNSYITQELSSVDTLVWSGSYYGGGVYNLSILYKNHESRSGSAVYINKVSDFFVKNVNIYNPYNGIREDEAGVVRLENVDISRAVYDSFLINGGPVQYLTNVSSYNDDDRPSHAGVEILSTGATHLVNSGMSGQGISVLIDPSGAAIQHAGWVQGQAFDIWISECDLDDASINGLSISPRDGGTVHSVQVIGTRIGVARAAGIVLGNPDPSISGVINDIVFSGDIISGSRKQGVVIFDGSDISFDGTQFLGNSIQEGNYAGIDLEGGDRINFNGVTSGKWKNLPKTQSYGLQIGKYFSGHIAFVGGNLSNNILGPYINNSIKSPFFSISNTISVNPVGVTLPIIGSSPWTYTAGPTQENMIISGGIISSISIDGKIFPFQGNVNVPLNPGQSVVIRYKIPPHIFVNAQ